MAFRPVSKSLRARYIWASFILILIIGGSLYWAQRQVGMASQTSTVHMQQLQHIERLGLRIQEAIWEVDFALYVYLFNPTNRLRLAFEQHLSTALQHINALEQEGWSKEKEQETLLLSLREDVVQLGYTATEVMDIRASREKRFPSSGTIVGALYPANLEFMTAASLAIEDILTSTNEPEESEEYRLFVDTRRLWGRIIESFRLFLAQRSEALGDPENQMPILISNIDLLYEGVERNLRRLAELDMGLLSFQSVVSLQEMTELANEWYTHFKSASAVHASGRWRSDDPIVRERLQPLSSRIRSELRNLNNLIQGSASEEVNTLNLLARDVVVQVWLAGAIVLFFLAAGYFYLEWGILRPVSRVSRALKVQAQEHVAQPLPEPRTTEIRDLISAFNQLSNSLSAAEQHRDTAEEVARHASKLSTVGELASCVAHEINNPLNNMIRLTEFIEKELQSKDGPQSVLEDLEVLRQEQRRCADIVQGLLDLGRPKVPTLVEVDMLALAEESSRLLARKAEKSKVSIKMHSEPDLDTVEGDPDQIEQVIVNILLNSIDSSPANGVINIYVENTGKNTVRCKVEDEGPGVPDSEVSRMFEPFYTTKSDREGIGLGLAVSSSIIQRHGGEMGAHRSPTGGFVVWFTVPRLGQQGQSLLLAR